MKWGRKKTPFSSSSYSYSPSPPCSKPSSLISHVFPVSWLSKFKHKSSSGNSEPRPRKGNSKAGKLNCSPSFMIYSPRCGAGTNNGTNYGQFYGLAADDDDDAFWRLSFRQDNADEKKKRAGVKSVWYDPDDDELGVPVSSCPNCRRKEAQKLNGVKNCKREKERDSISTRGTRSGKERKTRGELCNGEKRSTRSVGEKEERASETRRKCRYVSPVGARNPSLKTIEEEGLNSGHGQNHPKENAGFDWKVLKETKMEEVKSRNETQRKSLYVSREQQHGKGTKKINKVRAYSPRTASRLETCKVKALEDMKKAKLKMKKEEEAKERRRVEESKTGLDSFAVAKCSYDPQQDFKDSMLEMIVEKKMSKPEELEELLACYLTLNSDQYHDMIIKVFKQVWSELHQAYFGSELQNERIFNTI